LCRGTQVTPKVFSFPPGTAAFEHWDVRGGLLGWVKTKEWSVGGWGNFFNTTRSVILSNLKVVGGSCIILIVGDRQKSLF
jgi:hypothetical protein